MIVRQTRTVRRTGFTLMEVLVVVAILVILAGVGSVAVFSYLEKSKLNAAELQIKNIETAVQAYKIDPKHGSFPETLAVLSYPSIASMYGSYRVQAAADQVRAAWAEARTHAVNEGRPYRFSIVPNKRNFRVAPVGSNYWSGRGDGATNDTDNPPYIL